MGIRDVGAKPTFPIYGDKLDGRFIGGSGVVSGEHSASYRYEPQRKNNGMLIAPIPELKASLQVPPAIPGSLAFSLRSFEMPKDENDIIDLGWFNQRRKFAGQHHTDDISVTFIDYIDAPIMQTLESWRLSVYNPNLGAVGWASGSKGRSGIPSIGGYKHDVYLLTFSPNMNWVYTKVYRLTGAFPSRLDRGDVDYGDDEPTEITLTLSYDEVYFVMHGILPTFALYYNPQAAGVDANLIGARNTVVSDMYDTILNYPTV